MIRNKILLINFKKFLLITIKINYIGLQAHLEVLISNTIIVCPVK